VADRLGCLLRDDCIVKINDTDMTLASVTIDDFTNTLKSIKGKAVLYIKCKFSPQIAAVARALRIDKKRFSRGHTRTFSNSELDTKRPLRIRGRTNTEPSKTVTTHSFDSFDLNCT